MQCDAVRCNEVMDSGEVQRKIRESEVLEFPNFGNVRELLFVQVLKIDTGEAKNNTVQNDCASQPNDDASHPNDAERHQDACMVLNTPTRSRWRWRSVHTNQAHAVLMFVAGESFGQMSAAISVVPTRSKVRDPFSTH